MNCLSVITNYDKMTKFQNPKILRFQVFCDKGAERKARDEERRASKRRTTPSGKRRLDEMYHTPLERSEFYSMAELGRTPVSL